MTREEELQQKIEMLENERQTWLDSTNRMADRVAESGQRILKLEEQLAMVERQRQMDYQRGELGKGMYLEIFRSNMNKYPGKRQEWYVRLRAANHEILNTSEGFVTKWNAKRHAKKVFPYLEVKYIDA